MKAAYPVIFTRTGDEKDTYLIEIPDLKGTTAGYGIGNAVHMAKDYICCRLYDMKDADFPKATPLGKIDVTGGEFAQDGESFSSIVDVDMTAYRRMMSRRVVRCNVCLPGWLRDAAENARINLSQIFQDALKSELGFRDYSDYRKSCQ